MRSVISHPTEVRCDCNSHQEVRFEVDSSYAYPSPITTLLSIIRDLEVWNCMQNSSDFVGRRDDGLKSLAEILHTLFRGAMILAASPKKAAASVLCIRRLFVAANT